MTGPRIHHVEARASHAPARQYVSETRDHKPDAGERLHAAIITMLERIAARDADARSKVFAEIKRNGRWWAADEIIRLREDLARARQDLARSRGAA